MKPGFDVFPSNEACLLEAREGGFAGCISATANVTIAALAALARDWQGPQAEMRQDAITETRLMLQQFPAIPALKEIMASATGLDAWRRLRTPLINLAPDDAARLIEQAQRAGLIEAVRGS